MTLHNFGIKQGYRCNPGPVYFLDDVTSTRDMVFQPDVLDFAELLMGMSDDLHPLLIDVGCGWADKLVPIAERNPMWGFEGIDYGDNIRHCQATYDDDWQGVISWTDMDLETIAPDALYRPHHFGEHSAGGVFIVCSDVIEHLVDPVPLVRAFKGSQARAIIISTPERDIQYGYDHMGPSKNLCHVREWNAQELKAFLESEGLTVDHIGLTRGNDQTYAMGTILAVCH